MGWWGMHGTVAYSTVQILQKVLRFLLCWRFGREESLTHFGVKVWGFEGGVMFGWSMLMAGFRIGVLLWVWFDGERWGEGSAAEVGRKCGLVFGIFVQYFGGSSTLVS